MRKMRAIQWTRSLLEKPNEPVNDMSYFECLDTIMEKSKSLGDGMTGTANNANKALAKLGEPFGEAWRAIWRSCQRRFECHYWTCRGCSNKPRT
jgi:talin